MPEDLKRLIAQLYSIEEERIAALNADQLAALYLAVRRVALLALRARQQRQRREARSA